MQRFLVGVIEGTEISFPAGALALVVPSAATVPQRAKVVAEKDQLPQIESMTVFAVEPIDIGPRQADVLKDLSKSKWGKSRAWASRITFTSKKPGIW